MIRLIMFALVLISLISEVYKVTHFDEAIAIAKEMSSTTPETVIKVFKRKKVIALYVADFLYGMFSLILLTTNFWYIGIFILGLSIIQEKFYKYNKKAYVVDGTICIVLLMYFVFNY